VESCVLRNNISSPVRLEYTSGIIINNEIYENTTINDTASGNGAGIMVYTDKKVTIEGNDVHDNVSSGGRDGGGGIYAYAYDTGNVSILNNRVYSNRSDRHGGGLVAYSCRVAGNHIHDNYSNDSGGGLHAIRSTLNNNTVKGNVSMRGGGIYAEDSDVRFNLILENRAPFSKGGGLYYYGEGHIENNSFAGNGAGDTIVVSGNPLIRKNNIVAKDGYALRVGTHSLASDLDAGENYWGTASPSLIHYLVYDWLDDSDIGLVDWRNSLSEPTTEAPRLAPENLTLMENRNEAGEESNALKGVLSGNATLGETGGARYRVEGNILIPNGVRITVLPGTVFDISPDVTLRIRGNLYAVGTENRPVRFTGNRQQPWGTMFYDQKGDVPDSMQKKNNSGKLEHCIIENGKGIVMEGTGPEIYRSVIRNTKGSGVSIRNAAVDITRCLITENISPTNGGGIYTYGSKLVFLSNNKIVNNTAQEDGGGIFAYGYRSNTAANIVGNTIEGNLSRGDGGGVWASRSSLSGNAIAGNESRRNGGGVYATFALVKDNTIKDNTANKGGGVYAETNSTLSDNRILTNSAMEKLGGGVFLNFWGMSIKNEVFEGNTVRGNRSEKPFGAGGVYLNGAMQFTKNNIYDNSGYQLYNANPSDEGWFHAEECYWGTDETDSISAAIYDGVDDPELSRVEFYPFSKMEIKKMDR